MPEFDFVKSSYSNTGGQCVEVARNTRGVVAVRDSKTTPLGSPETPILRLSPTAWREFTAAQ
ncbi:hypothetical protein ADL01_07930 [Streptomyces sp. NRRL WC-3618]|uniref:DUF397 domain-containing protein n=1 Tax=Streptomyces sp. NRRL WC-3618 TaxID=1519490 RepID=UPI0006ADCC78|nr:DUF397 domain-containing protein [Streptomyces sp. NRRL WC-3618]KOV85803.1 hypothetical protein ADL01_07930 [Streptomyces sp. NRRL WC-3618]